MINMYLKYFLSVAFLIVYSLGGLCFGENSLPLSESFSEVQELSNELNNKFSEEVFLALLEIAKGESKHSEARVKAIGAIGYLSEAYQQEMSSLALPVLSEALRSDDPYVASSAARAIGAFGQFAESYIDDLIAVIEFNRDSSVGFNGIKSLGLIKAEPKKVVPFLTSLVPGRKSNGRAIWGRGDELDALSAYGHEASEAIPDLRLGLQDSDGDYALRAAKALANIDARDRDLDRFVRQSYWNGDSRMRFGVLLIIREIADQLGDGVYKEILDDAIVNGSTDDAEVVRSILRQR